MKQKIAKTKVTVKIRKAPEPNKWYLFVESYPVFSDQKSSPQRLRESVNRVVTTPMWVGGSKGMKRKPKRDVNGVIMCRTPQDQESCLFADKVRALRQREFDTQSIYNEREKEMIAMNERLDQDFIAYMRSVNRKIHQNSIGCYNTWERVAGIMSDYADGNKIPFKSITKSMLEDFKYFLLNTQQGGNKDGKISESTASTYFSVLKAALHHAFVDEFLETDIASKVENIRFRGKQREVLSQKEVEILAATPCEDEILKRAFFFSILTGLRLSDIQNMRWSHLSERSDGYRVEFRQQKTDVVDYLPISKQAFLLCGERKEPNRPVFEGLMASSWISRPLKKWVDSSGITKHITFHCARHTFATLQLENDTNIYTVMKMLGHTNVKTTQIYSHIVDKSKRKAAEIIKIENLKDVAVDGNPVASQH